MDGDSADVVAHYDQLAEHWEEITQGPAKRHVLLPAFHSLLPELEGLCVLDAGCGDGYYASWFADQGGDVTGIDLSEEMIAVARERYGDDAAFQQADVSARLPFEDEQFDLVVCQHVLSHLPSLETPMAEFARVLRPGGTLVVTTHHPFHDYLVAREEETPDTHESLDKDLDPLVVTDTEETKYHETERFQIYWGGSKESPPGTYYRRPISELLQSVLDAGLTVRDVVEPTPDETFTEEYPELAAELRRRPSRSICLRAER
jgi:SAM-dependent methyltransferase